MANENQWGSNLEFILTLLSYAVGIGNIWRFPYLCMRNGGGAFLVPYITFIALCGVPLVVLEVCMSQFSGLGAVKVWNICPLFKGIGIATVLMTGICVLSYNMLICWILYYLIKSFARVLPWSTCDNAWNTPSCWIHQASVNLTSNHLNSSDQIWTNHSEMLQYNIQEASNNTTHQQFIQNASQTWISPANEFWHNYVLDLSSGINELGYMKWELVGCALLSWVIIFLCLCKGTKTLGKVVYISAPIPYVILTILLIRGALLPGSLEGIKYYIIPKWKELLKFKVWAEAGLQVFYSFGPGWGCLLTMASYNKFKSPCIRDAVCVSLSGSATSIYAGFAIFSVIGFMAYKSELPIEDIVASGPGLAFMAYPEALARLPISPFWAVIFFLMLANVGINSQMFFVETVMNGIRELSPWLNKRRQEPVVLVAVLTLFLSQIIMCTQGGMYVFLVFDWYVGAFTTILVGLLESIVIFYIYGHGRFYADMELMLGHKPSMWWKICWGVICPIVLVVIAVYNLAALGEPYYREYTYPAWAIGIGWIIALISFVFIPIGMLKDLIKRKGPIKQRLRDSLKPSSLWGPSDPEAREQYKGTNKLIVNGDQKRIDHETELLAVGV